MLDKNILDKLVLDKMILDEMLFSQFIYLVDFFYLNVNLFDFYCIIGIGNS